MEHFAYRRAGQRQQSVRMLCVAVLCACLTLAGGATDSHKASEAGGSAVASARQNDAACAKCHAGIVTSYNATPMANASGAAKDHLVPGELDHTSSGTRYRVFEEAGSAWLSYASGQNAKVQGKEKLSYFLGSGHLGVTYLYSLDGYLFESPVAYYAATHGYDMKPGLAGMHQMPPALPMEAGCLRCHMSAVQRSDPGTINHYAGAPFLATGITCESCHGDTKAHVASGGRAAVLNPLKLTPERRDSLCMSCHLEGDVAVERKGRNALDYKPGHAISDYLSYFVFEGKNATSRGVSEIEQLARSKCKRMSGDAMSCMSCHDPHFTPSATERAAFYRAKCLVCHSEPRFAKEHHPEQPDCTSCHMPRTGAENIPHVAWTDHRILRVPDAGTVSPQAEKAGELKAIFSPSATDRDIAMAHYLALMHGDAVDRQKTYELLTRAVESGGEDDVALLDALGILSAGRGDFTKAEALFTRVLKLAPDDLTAASNLGVLRAKTGDMAAAIALLKPAYQRNEDVVGLAKNLAVAECAVGDAAAAQATIAQAARFSPAEAEALEAFLHSRSCTASGGAPKAP